MPRAAAANRSHVTAAAPGASLPLQPGVAALASRTGLPVIPVATDSGYCWGRRAFRKRPGIIHIAIGEALPAGLRRELGFPDDALVVMSLRNFQHRTNIDVLVRAFSRLAREEPR